MEIRGLGLFSTRRGWNPLAPGPVWFWLLLAVGAIIRIYLAVFTQGSSDVDIWAQHASGVSEKGLIAYYHDNPLANHPPFIGYAEALVLRLANATDTPFRIWLRLPFVAFDFGSTLLLLVILGQEKRRFSIAAAYWLHPLAIIFSAYHGNTDSSVAFFLLLCLWLLSRGLILGGGVALGIGFWIKLPGELAIPALLLIMPRMRNKLIFLIATLITAASTYLPALIQDPWVVYKNVFGFTGTLVFTRAGIPIWGFRVLGDTFGPRHWSESSIEMMTYIVIHGWKVGVLLLCLFAWLRRSHRSALEVGATIGAGYVILYGFTDSLAFQYFAWSLPFWFFLNKWFVVPASILTSGYVYSLYWVLCGNPWLVGKWDFAGHPYWPPVVMVFRNLAVLFFFISACWFVGCAVWERIHPPLQPVAQVKHQRSRGSKKRRALA